jgi:hypothetical protein
MLTLTQGANLGRFNFLHHFKTCLVKFPHGDFVDSANMMQRLRCLMDCGKGIGTVFTRVFHLHTTSAFSRTIARILTRTKSPVSGN